MSLAHAISGELEGRLFLLQERLAAWLTRCPAQFFSPDPATDRFCCDYLARLCQGNELREKCCNELGNGVWRPLGRVLLVASEKDALGTSLGFMACFLTGNAMRIKARRSGPLLRALREALDLDEQSCEILDWESTGQDDATLLSGVQGMVLAGGESLIRHYRGVAPTSVRLVEFGPKLSAIAVGELAEREIPALVTGIIHETCLFLQDVCSAPRFILVERHEQAERIFQALTEQLPGLPPLPEAIRLAQRGKAAARELMQRAAGGTASNFAFNAETGWAGTLDREFSPERWMPKGFTLISGAVDQHIVQAGTLWPGALQTLGYAGNWRPRPETPFSRVCPVGAMHCRPLTAPHDGCFELAALVVFLSIETET